MFYLVTYSSMPSFDHVTNTPIVKIIKIVHVIIFKKSFRVTKNVVLYTCGM